MTDKILVTDDSATARALFKACMPSNHQYQIFEADNLEDAITIAMLEKPDIIILDYNMPEKNGAEIAQAMQEKGVKAHFVLMSANIQDSILDEVKALGFVKILEKPVNSESVHELLEALS